MEILTRDVTAAIRELLARDISLARLQIRRAPWKICSGTDRLGAANELQTLLDGIRAPQLGIPARPVPLTWNLLFPIS